MRVKSKYQAGKARATLMPPRLPIYKRALEGREQQRICRACDTDLSETYLHALLARHDDASRDHRRKKDKNRRSPRDLQLLAPLLTHPPGISSRDEDAMRQPAPVGRMSHPRGKP